MMTRAKSSYNRGRRALLSEVSTHVYKSKRSKRKKPRKHTRVSNVKCSKFSTRNLSNESQKKVQRHIKSFLNQSLEDVDKKVGSQQSIYSSDSMVLMDRRRNVRSQSIDRQVHFTSKHNCPKTHRNIHPPNDSRIGNDKADAVLDVLVTPQKTQSNKMLTGLRKYSIFKSGGNGQSKKRKLSLKTSSRIKKRDVNFNDSHSRTLNNSYLKNIENIPLLVPSLQDSTYCKLVEDNLLRKEVSHVSNMLEKQVVVLNGGSKESTLQKKVENGKWDEDKLEIISTNISNDIPPLTLDDKTLLTYDNMLNSAMKVMFSNNLNNKL